MKGPIVFFDGICNLCDSTVQFIIKEDKKNIFKFAAIQSKIGQKFIIENNLSTEAQKTVILFYNEKLYFRSNAILRILILLGGYLKLFAYVMFIIPRPIRDWIYNYIATKRYLWFGKKEQCMVSTPELKDKFL